MQNSVTCLQDDWWDVFGFIKEVVEVFKGKKEGVEYECDDPIVKIKMSEKTQRTTKRVEMK